MHQNPSIRSDGNAVAFLWSLVLSRDLPFKIGVHKWCRWRRHHCYLKLQGKKKVPYCTTVETVYLPLLFPPFSPCFPDMFHRFPISRPTHGTWKRSLPPETTRPPWWESTPSGSSSWQRPAWKPPLEEISGDGGNFMGIIWKYGDSLVRIFNGKVRKLHGDDGIIAGLHEWRPGSNTHVIGFWYSPCS